MLKKTSIVFTERTRSLQISYGVDNKMNKTFQTLLIFAVCLMIIPAFILLEKGFSTVFENSAKETLLSEDCKEVSILDTETKDISVMDIKDYLIWNVMAQMPGTFEKEALKAQAVLSHTYILNRYINEKENPTKALLGAIISTDNTVYPKSFTTDEAKEYYGDKYETALNNVTAAVNETVNEICIYDNQPIVAAYHTISCGKTESSKDIWNEDVPYLVSVDSISDEKAEGFSKTTTVSAEEFKKNAEKTFSVTLPENSADWIKILTKTKNGTPLTISLGGKEIQASELCTALDLPSQHFETEIKDGNINFITKGLGHLVGMSQFGANSLAKDRKNYKEILQYYFPKTELFIMK